MDENFYTCAECGKKFYNTAMDQYIYKRYDHDKGFLYFCGWNCLRKYEKKREEEKKARRARK